MFNNKVYILRYIAIVSLLLNFANPIFGKKKVSQITQYGITWTFEKPVVAGKYITGDWWVVGPVKVMRVSPNPGSVSVDSTKIGLNHWSDTSLRRDTTMRNGSMIVIKPNASQGYDSRNQLFDRSDCVSFPVVLEPNQSLISTISNTNLPVEIRD